MCVIIMMMSEWMDAFKSSYDDDQDTQATMRDDDEVWKRGTRQVRVGNWQIGKIEGGKAKRVQCGNVKKEERCNVQCYDHRQ